MAVWANSCLWQKIIIVLVILVLCILWWHWSDDLIKSQVLNQILHQKGVNSITFTEGVSVFRWMMLLIKILTAVKTIVVKFETAFLFFFHKKVISFKYSLGVNCFGGWCCWNTDAPSSKDYCDEIWGSIFDVFFIKMLFLSSLSKYISFTIIRILNVTVILAAIVSLQWLYMLYWSIAAPPI